MSAALTPNATIEISELGVLALVLTIVFGYFALCLLVARFVSLNSRAEAHFEPTSHVRITDSWVGTCQGPCGRHHVIVQKYADGGLLSKPQQWCTGCIADTEGVDVEGVHTP